MPQPIETHPQFLNRSSPTHYVRYLWLFISQLVTYLQPLLPSHFSYQEKDMCWCPPVSYVQTEHQIKLIQQGSYYTTVLSDLHNNYTVLSISRLQIASYSYVYFVFLCRVWHWHLHWWYREWVLTELVRLQREKASYTQKKRCMCAMMEIYNEKNQVTLPKGVLHVSKTEG